jgi:hypothetical protein
MERTVPVKCARKDAHEPGYAMSPLRPDVLRAMDACWRAANYLSVGQFDLRDVM